MIEVCTVCGQRANDPYRVHYADGTVLEGCVASFHDAFADDWHRRPEADVLRRIEVHRIEMMRQGALSWIIAHKVTTIEGLAGKA